MLNSYQRKSVAIGSFLVLINLFLMWVLTYTPIPQLTLAVFNYLIVGMLVFFGLFFLGTWLIDSGIKYGRMGKAYLGIAVLQLAYGAFGSGVLSLFDQSIWAAAILVSAFLAVLLAVICGTIAYSSDKDFRGWQRYASYTFLSALVVGLIGTFIPFFAIIVFLLTFAGFFMYLVYEIWATKVNYQYVLLNGVGLYSAFMGVFLHILQIILRVLASRRD